MSSRAPAAAALLTALAVLGAPVSLPGAAAGADTPPNGAGTAGPPYAYDTALMGGYTLIPLPDQAMISRTELGYRFRAGQQDSRLTVTLVGGRLRFEDTGTARWKKLPRRCRAETVAVGVAASCRLPAGLTEAAPLLLEVWPRLGDDHLDASTLPATFALTMLADAGDDVALFGAGPDFFNGFTGVDQVSGGDGNDWIRTGDGADVVWGGGGDDQIVATDGADVLYGDEGADLLGGGAGNDSLDGGPGADLVKCDAGTDTAINDSADRLRFCETLTASRTATR